MFGIRAVFLCYFIVLAGVSGQEQVAKPEHEQNISQTNTKNQEIHPLDPLTSQEIQNAVQIFKASKEGSTPNDYIYNYIALHEPAKSVLLPFFLSDTYPNSKQIPRKAFFVLSKKTTGFVFEAVVNLHTKQLESFIRIFDVRVPLTPDDWLNPDIDIIRADQRVQERCAALGFPDMNLVTGGPWNIGFDYGPQYAGKKLVAYFLQGQNFPLDNHYAHPMDFVVLFDLDTRSVVGIDDLPTHSDLSRNNTGNSAPKKEGNYLRELRKRDLRKDSKPITADSPQGVSFSINGTEIKWQKWKMRLGYNGREGIVIHTLSYDDNGKNRPILYRASLAEMFVRYGDGRKPFRIKGAFDIGEFGFGYNLDEQILNQDVIGDASFINVVLHDAAGNPVIHKNAISVREEDAGVLWKHFDYRTEKGAVARSHRLVLSGIGTFGNYEYILNWMFYQDGSIQFLAQLTGIVSTDMLSVGANPAGSGTIVAPQVNAQYHQHFFSVRLDVEIDGNSNSVSTVDVVPVDDETGSDKNPSGQGFTINQTLLKTAGEARTKFSSLTARTWLITNPSQVNEYTGHPKGWKLVPQNSPPLMMKQNSPMRKRAAFLDFDVWTTPYQENQLFPGGFYLNESGLPVWVRNKPEASTENTDIVVWHNFGVVHIPRVEDFPVMPVESVGFWLKPVNFFLENPGIDVP